MVDHTTASDGSVDIERVFLIDTENALPVKDEHFMYEIDIGHRFWRSPEAHARRMIGRSTDLVSLGLVGRLTCEYVSSRCLNDESDDPPPAGRGTFHSGPRSADRRRRSMVAGLEQISHFFGEYPEDFAKRLEDGLPENEEIWYKLLGFLNSELKKPGNYELFLDWDTLQVASEDSAFIWSFVSKLDPLERKSARALLNDAWVNT
jgi:hypothetical protein